jgi:hypothetical protein
VDYFLTEKIFNDFTAQMAKSLEMRLFIYFLEGRALFQCPTPVLAQNTRLSGDLSCQHPAYSGGAFDPNLSGFSADFCAWLGA